MTKTTLIALLLLLSYAAVKGQPCSPAGDETTYGTNNTWIGYVYDNMDGTSYKGYVTEGSAGTPGFDQSFGGSNTTYATNGCSINTTTFRVKYKLQKNFTAGTYGVTVGGDDGYRLSIDGGSTWVIDRMSDQSYNTTTVSLSLSGLKSLVLEYYENSGDNRISFSISLGCQGTENESDYGTNNTWNGYLYDGLAFDVYAGKVTQGAGASANFDQDFGGSNVSFATSGCPVQTETFSARYRLRKTFVNRSVSFTVGADDGFRLSLDGGNTWVINRWALQSYTSQLYTTTLNGTYDLVLEYYENSGDNRISFAAVENIVLPIRLMNFNGTRVAAGIRLNWQVSTGGEKVFAELQRSSDGIRFTGVGSVESPAVEDWKESFTDESVPAGHVYYRLRLTGSAGTVSYSPVVSFGGGTVSSVELLLYPANPSRGMPVYLVSPKKLSGVQVAVTDLSGRLLSRTYIGSLEAGHPYVLDTDKLGLTAGLQLVTLVDATGSTTTRKLVLR